MALVSLPSVLEYPGQITRSYRASTLTTALTAAGHKTAAILYAPKTGTISKIGFRTTAVSNPQTLDCRIETVSNGRPSGTLWGSNTNGLRASPAANTFYWVTLTNGAAVTRGDIFAVVITWAGPPGNVTILDRVEGNGVWLGRPFVVIFNTAWQVWGDSPTFAVEYADGSRPHCGSFPVASTAASQEVSTATTPDEVGLRFSLPFSAKCAGAVIKTSTVATTYAVKLYDADGSTVLRSVVVDSSSGPLNGSPQYALFDTDVTLAKDVQYRVTFVPQTTTNLTFYSSTLDSSATREAWPWGLNAMWTERADGGAWTNIETKLAPVSLLLSALDDGAGGGGAASPILGGGVVR